MPGPTLRVREGDSLVIHVFNQSPYGITLHWHGIFQLFSAWADGPEYTTQCPISPGNSYTYRFNVTKQEGTLWWHAHILFLRTTVHGALIILPRDHSYPFPKPYREVPIMFGEWWDSNVVDVMNEAVAKGDGPNDSIAFTMNGQPGDLYPCASNRTFKLKAIPGMTYLLRIINAALNTQFFFKIARHKMTVVAIDASYTNPFETEFIAITPGQTVDVLLTANQVPSSYYMVAHPYVSGKGARSTNRATTGILVYENANLSKAPVMPLLPKHNDTAAAHWFYSGPTSLVNAPHWTPVPEKVDVKMFIATGLGIVPCERPGACTGTLGQRLVASMNNESFKFPTKLSMLEAFYYNASGIYTADFPEKPPKEYDFSNYKNVMNKDLLMTRQSTKLKKLKFNSTVEIVFQSTALIVTENHPMHIHGFNFYVLGQGFGNYDPINYPKTFNLVNPQIRNTIGVPVAGWLAVRFQANNPGVWLMHCHMDTHLMWGQSMAFLVENGPTRETSLPPPPPDLPKCMELGSIANSNSSTLLYS
ncbi:laccase-7-like isoform X2 [Diospyros lotus]|nr:laccase-7-like isoform X2 [Diospyros lotus]